MKKNIFLVCMSVMLISMLAGCSKNAAIPNFNTIAVTFNNAGPKYVTSDITVNPKDSIQFSYTVTSPTRMQYVYLMKNGSAVASDTLKTGSKLSFTAIKKLVADTAAGPFTYQVVARDTAGVYLGGSGPITVTTTADFNYYINRTLFVPDTTNKTNPCYIDLADGKVFSYKDVSANVTTNSSLIDLGYYFNTDSIYVKKVKTVVGHTIYALNITPPLPSQISFYDISTWTQNATQIKIAAAPTFASLLSGGGIKAGGILNLKTGASNNFPSYVKNGTMTQTVNDSFVPLASGNVIWVKTVGGKYAAIQIDYINQNSAVHGTFMTVDVKIQK